MMYQFMCVTHVFGGLQVDNHHFPSFALGEEWEVSTGFYLHGGTERQGQVSSSVCRYWRNMSQVKVTRVPLVNISHLYI